MRALKFLVIAMGVLLVLGIIALAIAVADRINHPRPAATAPASSAIALPQGAKVIGSDIAGDRVVTRIALPDGGEELVLTNLANGATVATILLRPTAAAPP